MADKFPIDVAQLLALPLKSIFYGLHIVTLCLCVQVLLFSPHRHNIKRRSRFLSPFFLVTLIMFALGTFDLALAIQHVMDAFVWYNGPGGAKGEFANISYWVNVMQTVIYFTQSGVADKVLIYRCFVVYNRNWLILVALSLFSFALAVCSAFTAYIEFTLHTEALLNVKRLTPFVTPLFVLALALNLIATSLIVYKIWSVSSDTAEVAVSSYGNGRHGSSMRHAMRIIIESGAIYTTAVVIFFITYLSRSNAQYVVAACMVQLIGIVFNLLIIRLDRGRSISDTENRPHDTGVMSNPMLFGSPSTRHTDSEVGPMEFRPGEPLTSHGTSQQ
ncbi:hypothetical protein BXZ70DRAFT_455547 [Cristinia sonorae]|uniref:Uncharacterized protein n=1 Tax=Cristinia sonorae TaxID=1940300 RepID=A0A8K0XM20_9AGAR|nr:hypothetical protein BXZ70DRAFT_455547 [Cristinia sonorae]